MYHIFLRQNWHLTQHRVNSPVASLLWRREEENPTKTGGWAQNGMTGQQWEASVIAAFLAPVNHLSHHHVQNVDKKHHPTDSLINCEATATCRFLIPLPPKKNVRYLPALLFLFHLSVNTRNKLDSSRTPFFKKKEKKWNCSPCKFSAPFVHMNSHITTSVNTHSVFKHRNMRTWLQKEHPVFFFLL